MKKQYRITAKRAIAVVLLFWGTFFFLRVKPPFRPDFSTIVFDRNGKVLRVTCAPDEQLRIPLKKEDVPPKYKTAVVAIEDKRFYYHPGVDPLAIGNAFIGNVLSGLKKKRGGSTIPMQVARLAKPGKRTYIKKIRESFNALRYSLHYSKDEVLRLYAGHVPLGGNIVGIASASWYYYGKALNELTWAEAVLFAVLPNNPSMINMKKQRGALKEKRDRGLKKLYRLGRIDSLTCNMAVKEPLPSVKSQIPFKAPHFAEFVMARYPGRHTIHTTLDMEDQKTLENVIKKFHRQYRGYGIQNMAAILIETQTGIVRGYAGSHNYFDTLHNGKVDGVQARRSTGSLLKPLLAAKALDRGPWLLESQLLDVPTWYGSFTPRNASREFNGIVTLDEMLVHSLNVPAVRLLYAYGQPEFYSDLKNMGMTSLFRTAGGYGLSLILGGAEGNLWELTRIYNSFGREGIIFPLTIRTDIGNDTPITHVDSIRAFGHGTAWLVSRALSRLQRPGSEHYWQFFSDQVPVAWKTGTSYGQRDGWAIGVNRQWTIGVWVGNFSGEGNAMLGGALTAGPVLFSLFRAFHDPSKEAWFEKPEYDLKETEVCSVSGYAPSPSCQSVKHTERPVGAWKTKQCPFHQRIVINRKTGLRVCSRCWQGSDTTWISRAVYPPSVMEILTKKGISIEPLPGHNASCTAVHSQTSTIEIEYPVLGAQIFLPRNMQGEYEHIVAKAHTSDAASPLYWFIDNVFKGETIAIHTLPFRVPTGKHTLSVADKNGSSVSVSFSVNVKE